MDDFFWAAVIVLIVAAAVSLSMYAFMTFLLLAGVITILILPASIVGFIEGVRNARRDHTNDH